jgi:hypothetical protein
MYNTPDVTTLTHIKDDLRGMKLGQIAVHT